MRYFFVQLASPPVHLGSSKNASPREKEREAGAKRPRAREIDSGERVYVCTESDAGEDVRTGRAEKSYY